MLIVLLHRRVTVMHRLFPLSSLLLLLLGPALSCSANEAPASPPAAQTARTETLHAPRDRGSYSLGYQIGKDLQRQGMDPNLELFERGVLDALANTEPLLDEASRRAAMTELRAQAAQALREKQARETELKRAAGRAYMAGNVTRPGVMTTPSGMQYQVLNPGVGKAPTAKDSVTVHYRGTLLDGSEFDSSYRRGQPASFQLSGVIPGWTEGLQLIQEGGKILLTIPPELAYGERGRLAHETLLFEVELISVQSAPSAESTKP
jgi:FKBP-type peptidyl-prolyl cis-trans isomerase